MSISFNHTIVAAKNREQSANYFTELFGLAPALEFGPFLAVALDHGASLDFAKVSDDQDIHPQHYAFLVSEEDFDGILARIQAQGIPYWADPGRSRPQQINHNDGGRGVYFADPDGHFLEAITRPYGSDAA